MKIKKYTAHSMKEALLLIKEDLGEEAIILKTARAPRTLFSLSGGAEIEVTAAIDDEAPTRRALPAMPSLMPDAGVYKRPKPGRQAQGPDGAPEASEAFPHVRPRLSNGPETAALPKINVIDLKEDLRELRELLGPLFPDETADEGEFTGPAAVLYSRLIDSGVNADIARRLISRGKGASEMSAHETEKRFMDALQALFPVSGPLKLKQSGPFLCAFIGPTGVGKTTTLAKLAAHYRLNKNKSVSLITADTYRIAAIEQIRTFADIMGIRLQVVFSPEETAGALEACAGDEIVFVDTGGRSPNNIDHMRDLQNFMEKLRPDETHLVLSATTKDADLAENIKRYRPMGVNRVLFTKFDETIKLGNVFNAVVTAAIPVSYFTFGQSVPDDIELAQPGRFIRHLWKDGPS